MERRGTGNCLCFFVSNHKYYMKLKCISKDSSTIITVNDFKNHLYIEDNQDAEILKTLTRARDTVEQQTNQILVNQTWTQIQDYLCSKIKLPLGNVDSLVVQYYDENNDLQTLDSGEYFFSNDYIYITSPPTVYDRDDAVFITMDLVPDRVDDKMKELALQVAIYMWNNRGDEDAKIPSFIDRLTQVNRMGWL